MPSTSVPPSLLKAGITAAKAGQREQARDLLLQRLEQDEQDVTAWLWLSSVVDDLDEQEICLENILAIDPDNQMAQKGLRLLAQKKSHCPTPAWPKPDTPPAQPVHRPKYKRLAARTAAVPQQQDRPTRSSYRRLTPATSPSKPPPCQDERYLEEDPLSNEYACPYCATRNKPKTQYCQQCEQFLWFYIPHRSTPSRLFTVLLGMQVIDLIGMVSQSAVLIYGWTQGELVSPTNAGLTLGLTFFFIVGLVGMLQRWRIIYYFYLFQATVITGFLFIYAGLCGRTLAYLGIAQLFMFFNLGEDFTFDKVRIRLEFDPDATTAATLMEKGNLYAKQKMWALAALHFRAAASRWLDRLEPQLSLAVAYNNLKMYDRMIEPVRRAQRINPNDRRVEGLVQLIEQRQAG